MGADTKALRSRIKSVNSTLHLTKAMGLVASSKIRRATDAMLKGRAYTDALDRAIALLLTSAECKKSPYLQRRGERVRLIVIAGDQGLAGGYNANVFRLLAQTEYDSVVAIGKRACDRFPGGYVSAERFCAADASALAHQLCEQYLRGEFDRLGMISTVYRSMMTQEAELSFLLPLVREEQTGQKSVLFEPDERTVLDAAVPELIAGKIAAAVRESFACEVAARRMAMDSAGKNAKQMIDDLTLAYNRARQSSITQEITEIVAGGDAQ